MTNDIAARTFLEAARTWLCPGYFLDFRYIASRVGDKYEIRDASLGFGPLASSVDLRFRIEAGDFVIGQSQEVVEDASALLAILTSAVGGTVALSNVVLGLAAEQPLNFYSEMSLRDRWFLDLHLQISGPARPNPTAAELGQVDSALRLAQPPFDGISDAAAWLGLRTPESVVPTLNIRVLPPVDLILDKCSLTDNKLHLTLHAHPAFDVTRVGLALRSVPASGLAGRRRAQDMISWGDVRDGRREGTADISLENADSVLVMLMIGNSTVRRNWFVDSLKARNNRLAATQHFDKDLKMVRHALLETSDGLKFERGVASLLFLLGFSPGLQMETDAPDLVVATPGGRLAIVECTTRIADFSAKIGKLVDRRGSLSKHLTSMGHPMPLAAALVCRLPRDQIAAQADELRAHRIILIAGEDIAQAFDRIRIPNDPDKMLAEALARISHEDALG